MDTLNAMINLADQQYSSTSRFAAWRRAVTMALDPGGVFSGGLVSLAQACAGEVQLSSPLGQWMLKLSQDIEDGSVLISGALGPLHGQIGQGPFLQWADRITAGT